MCRIVVIFWNADSHQGATRARLEQLRTEIIQCLALVEALIDFGEGEDIEEGVYDQGLRGYQYNVNSYILNESQRESEYHDCATPYNITCLTIAEEKSCALAYGWRYLVHRMLERAVY